MWRAVRWRNRVVQMVQMPVMVAACFVGVQVLVYRDFRLFSVKSKITRGEGRGTPPWKVGRLEPSGESLHYYCYYVGTYCAVSTMYRSMYVVRTYYVVRPIEK